MDLPDCHRGWHTSSPSAWPHARHTVVTQENYSVSFIRSLTDSLARQPEAAEDVGQAGHAPGPACPPSPDFRPHFSPDHLLCPSHTWPPCSFPSPSPHAAVLGPSHLLFLLLVPSPSSGLHSKNHLPGTTIKDTQTKPRAGWQQGREVGLAGVAGRGGGKMQTTVTEQQ